MSSVKIFIGIFGFLLVLFCFFIFFIKKESSQNFQTIHLYYYNAEQDKNEEGNNNCSKKGLVAIDRTIAQSANAIQDTIKLLLEGRITEKEKAQGITTEYPLAGVELIKTSLNNGELTLEFIDPQNKTSGGSCRVSILQLQIETTAKQFPEVQSVKFIPEELFQP